MARHFESPTRVWCTGWTAAANVQRLETEDYRNVARVTLDNDPAWWPTPPGPQLGHFGVLEAATPLDPPDGWRWVAPRFSKR